MTAINVFPLRDVAYLFGDGASYDLEGNLLSIGSKAHILGSLSAAMIFTGRSILSPYIVHHLAHQATSFDHLMTIMPDRLAEIEDHLTELFGIDQSPQRQSSNQGYRIFAAGWSEERERIVAFSIASVGDALGDEPYMLHEAPEGFMTPPLTAEQRKLGFGSVNVDVTAATIEDVAVTQIELQRQFGHRNTGGDHCSVGGLIELVTVRKDHVESKILRRFDEDVMGLPMMPAEVDWAARRARRAARAVTNAGVNLDGLSKLQRDRMLKKARKGTLRSV